MEWLGIKVASLSGWIAGAFGSLLAMYFNKDSTQAMSRIELLFVFLAGWGLAHWIGGFAIDYWKIDVMSASADGIKLAIGFIGMASLAEIKIQLPLILSALRKRFIGE